MWNNHNKKDNIYTNFRSNSFSNYWGLTKKKQSNVSFNNNNINFYNNFKYSKAIFKNNNLKNIYKNDLNSLNITKSYNKNFKIKSINDENTFNEINQIIKDNNTLTFKQIIFILNFFNIIRIYLDGYKIFSQNQAFVFSVFDRSSKNLKYHELKSLILHYLENKELRAIKLNKFKMKNKNNFDINIKKPTLYKKNKEIKEKIQEDNLINSYFSFKNKKTNKDILYLDNSKKINKNYNQNIDLDYNYQINYLHYKNMVKITIKTILKEYYLYLPFNLGNKINKFIDDFIFDNLLELELSSILKQYLKDNLI